MEEKKIEEIAALNAAKHGYKADFGAVLSKVIGEDKSSLQDMTKTKELVLRAVKKINSMSKQEIDELIKDVKITEKKEDTDLRPLPNTEKKVVLRLPPEPSGYMHLGHAIAGMINYLYKQKYNGKLWLRFEDTNPNRVKEEFFDSFRSGYSWLGIKWDEEKKVSDDMEKIYDYAE
ncbi:MAG: glutamate--tRNA ligase family protein, partial [Nanoarchaeota archaeon]|nr:glutamate--tRNA ligase family protein [Nanoarchaeota archaeon]